MSTGPPRSLDSGQYCSNDDETLHDSLEHQSSVDHAKQALVDLKDETKQKSKRLMHAFKHDKIQDRQHEPVHDLLDNAAFDPSQLKEEQQATVGGATDKVLNALRHTGKAIANPKHAFKSMAASKMEVGERPYMSQQADADYLEAHRDLFNATSPGNGTPDEDEVAHFDASKDRVEQIEDTRDARKVAWTTSRHVMRVVVVANQSTSPPNPADFYHESTHPGKRKFDWESYFYARNRYLLRGLAVTGLGGIDMRPQEPFDKDVCIKYIERVLIATAPWQSWSASLRDLYRWEDPRKTSKWAFIWFVIWYFDLVMTFVLSWMIFIVLQNKFYRKRAEAQQESHTRSLDTNRKAFRFNELIIRHGPGQWFDPLMDEVGPMAQMYLSDTADFLEILANFYDWKDPFLTWSSLFWYGCAVLLGVCVPTGYSWRIITMFALLGFFCSRPIASRHPQYRHVVNAFRWIFWDIPNDAEWSFAYLRRKAQETRERIIEQQIQDDHDTRMKSDHDSASTPTPEVEFADCVSRQPSIDSSTHDLSDLTLQSFSVRHDGSQCRLHILPTGLVLRRSSPLHPSLDPIWRITWHRLREMRKCNHSSAAAKLVAAEGIELLVAPANDDNDDDDDDDPSSPLQIVRVSGLRDRDRVFNLIIGFSGLSYQVLPPVAAGVNDERGDERGGGAQADRAEGVMQKVKRKVKRGRQGHRQRGEGDQGDRYDAYQAFREGGWESGWFA